MCKQLHRLIFCYLIWLWYFKFILLHIVLNPSDMRKTLLLIVCILVAGRSFADKNMRDVWLSMPDSLNVYVDSVMRHDLVTFHDMGLTSEITNRFADITSIDTLGETYMSVTLSSSTQMQMRLLATTDSNRILCIVKTFRDTEGYGESDVRFYSVDWEPLVGSYGLPSADDEQALRRDFLLQPDTMNNERFAELSALIDPVMLCAELATDEPAITLTLSTPLLRKEEEEEVKTIIKQNKLNWHGDKFK